MSIQITAGHTARTNVVLVPLLISVSFIYGILSGITALDPYAASHLVIDYHFGFGKRGLIGALLGLFDTPPYHYATLGTIAFVVFVIWAALLVQLGRRLIRADFGMAAAYALFFLSAGFASLTSDLGRGEHFGLMLGLACLLMPAGPVWLLGRAALLAIAVLMHEMNFLIIVPLAIFDCWLALRPERGWRAALPALAVALPATLLTAYLGSAQTACDTDAATAYFQHLVADFQVNWFVVHTLCNDGHANLRLAYDYIWTDGAHAVLVPLTLVVALPSTVYNLVLAWPCLRGRWPVLAAGLLAVFVPLSLLAVAADIIRFMTLVQLTSLLALVAVMRRLGRPISGTYPASAWRLPMILALAGFQLGSALPLNDGQPMRKFPFTSLLTAEDAATP